MKLKLSVLSLSAFAVLMTACEPRDSKITRPDTRATTTGGPGGTTQADGKADNYKYIAILADRQVESIELYRALTDAAYATAKNITIEDVEIDGAKLKKVTSKSVVKNDQYETTRDLALTAALTVDADGKLQKIEANEIKSQLSFEKVLKVATKTDVSLKNREKHIVIQRVVADDSWDVTTELQDQINVKAGKSLMLNTLRFNFAATDGNQDVFKIKNVQMNHERYGVQAGDFNMKSDDATTMTISMKTAEQCSSISGVLHLNSIEQKADKSPLYDRTLTYDQSNVVVKAGKDTFNLSAPDCEGRLSVDLRKIL